MVDKAGMNCKSGQPIDGVGAAECVERVLREEFDLARPDDLAFLEFQVPRIAQRIVRLLQETEVEITPQMVDEGAAHQVRAKICA